jgi:hypothetical protein
METPQFFEYMSSTAVKRQVAGDGDADSSESKRPRIEARHAVQDWTSPAVNNGWQWNDTCYGESTRLDDVLLEGNTASLIPDHLSVTSDFLAGSEMTILHSGQPHTVESSYGSIQPVTSDVILGSEWQGLDSGDLGDTWDMSFPTLWDLGRLYESGISELFHQNRAWG